MWTVISQLLQPGIAIQSVARVGKNERFITEELNLQHMIKQYSDGLACFLHFQLTPDFIC